MFPPSAESTCPHEGEGRTYFNAHAGIATAVRAVHTVIVADQHIVCRERPSALDFMKQSTLVCSRMEINY